MEPVSEPPGPGEAFEVRITIRDARGLRTGSDRGWLIFSEGWILFEGAGTEFAVTRGESYRRSREPGLGLKLEDGRTVEISSVTGPSIPYPLNRAFKDWEVTPIPDGEAVLPPREVHPEIWAERHSLSSFGAIAAATVGGFGLAFGSWPVIALAAVVLGGCLIHGADCVRQLCGALRHSLSVPTPSLGGGQEGRGLATVER